MDKRIFSIYQLKQFYYGLNNLTQKLVLDFGSSEGLCFENVKVQSTLVSKRAEAFQIMGFYWLRYSKHCSSFNRHVRDFQISIPCGSKLVFVYIFIDITENQNVGDVKALLIKIIEPEKRLGKISINTVTIHHKVYTILDYKPILINTIQNFHVELSNKTGKVFPFTDTRKVRVSLKFQFEMFHTTAIKHLNQCLV